MGLHEFKCDSIKRFAVPSRNRAFFQSIHNLRKSRHWSVILIAQSCLNLINLKNGHTCQAVFHFIIMSVMFLPLLPFTWNIPVSKIAETVWLFIYWNGAIFLHNFGPFDMCSVDRQWRFELFHTLRIESIRSILLSWSIYN